VTLTDDTNRNRCTPRLDRNEKNDTEYRKGVVEEKGVENLLPKISERVYASWWLYRDFLIFLSLLKFSVGSAIFN